MEQRRFKDRGGGSNGRSRARALLAGEARLEIVPGAGHLFEEPGTLEHVAALARAWFARHLGSRVS